MVNVDLDKELYYEIKKIVRKNKYTYPSIKFFVQRAIYNEILHSNNILGENFEKFYSKIKEILRDNSQLKDEIDEVYNSEVKKFRRGIIK